MILLLHAAHELPEWRSIELLQLLEGVPFLHLRVHPNRLNLPQLQFQKLELAHQLAVSDVDDSIVELVHMAIVQYGVPA
jgi:hypothetical protein